MRVIVLSSVVSFLLLICSPIFLYSQIKLYDFEKVNYLSNPNFSVIDGDYLFSINYSLFQSPDGGDCNYKFVRYDLKDGKVNEILNADISEGSDCYRPKMLYRSGEEIITISEISNINEATNDKVSVTIHSDNISKTYFEKQSQPSVRILNDKVRPFIDNSFYKLDYSSSNTDEIFYTNKLYKITIDDDYLDKQLVFTNIIDSQFSHDVLIYDNSDYFTTFNLFNSLLDYEEIIDTLSKFEIYRFNKLDLSIDTIIIEKKYTYISPKTFEINNKFYFAVSKQDSSIKNKYLLDNKITIFGYEIETNKFEKVVDIEFNHKIELKNIHFDEYTGMIYFYGSASTNGKTFGDGTYSDYWISVIDTAFNIKNEFSWNGTNVDRLEEEVYYLNTDNEGLIIGIGEHDIVDRNNNKSNFIKMSRDLVSDVNQPVPAVNFSLYPNPTTNYINIKTFGLPYNLELFNYSGKKVIEKSGIFDIDYNLDISEFPQGIYTLKVNNKGIIQTKNLIITK